MDSNQVFELIENCIPPCSGITCKKRDETVFTYHFELKKQDRVINIGFGLDELEYAHSPESFVRLRTLRAIEDLQSSAVTTQLNPIDPELRSEVFQKYRIVTDGDRFKVQRRRLWLFWEDQTAAGKYRSILPGGVGHYDNRDDAVLALNALVDKECRRIKAKRHGWKSL